MCLAAKHRALGFLVHLGFHGWARCPRPVIKRPAVFWILLPTDTKTKHSQYLAKSSLNPPLYYWATENPVCQLNLVFSDCRKQSFLICKITFSVLIDWKSSYRRRYCLAQEAGAIKAGPHQADIKGKQQQRDPLLCLLFSLLLEEKCTLECTATTKVQLPTNTNMHLHLHERKLSLENIRGLQSVEVIQ